MPDSPREAELLVLLLEAGLNPKAGLYPKADSAEPEKTRPDKG